MPLTVISDGRTPWELFAKQRMIANSRADLCSRILKRDLLWKWITERYKPDECAIYLGLDWTEEHRIVNTRKCRPGWNIYAPMMHEPVWSKQRMLDELTELGITIPRLYSMGFPHNNCGGFCVKAGQAQFAHLLRKMPERYAFHEAEEEKMRMSLGKNVSVLKDRRGKTSKPLTLKVLREWIESGTEFDTHDWGGCGCAVDKIPRLRGAIP